MQHSQLDKALFLERQSAQIKPLLKTEPHKTALEAIQGIDPDIINSVREKRNESLQLYIEGEQDKHLPFYTKEEQKVVNILEGLPEEVVKEILELEKTKLFLLEKSESERNPDARNILITMADPGAWTGIAPLIKKLKNDPRCKKLLIMTDNMAGQFFTDNEIINTEFKEISHPAESKKLLMTDAMNIAKAGSFDIEIATLTTHDGPDRVLLYGGKEHFGAQATKTYLVVECWTAEHLLSQKTQVYGVFCNDKLSFDLFTKNNPEIDPSRVFITGTGQTDVPAKNEIPGIIESGRGKIGIKGNKLSLKALF